MNSESLSFSEKESRGSMVSKVDIRNRKLTKFQKDVLDKMSNGWQLGQSIDAMDSRFWIQKGGCGRGGVSQDINASTVRGLIDRGLIRVHKRQFPLQTYDLSR